MTREALPGPESADGADSASGATGNHAQLRLQFPTSEEARTVAAALAPDNEGHVTAQVEGTSLILAADSDSFMGLLRSIDDVLGCVRALGHD